MAFFVLPSEWLYLRAAGEARQQKAPRFSIHENCFHLSGAQKNFSREERNGKFHAKFN